MKIFLNNSPQNIPRVRSALSFPVFFPVSGRAVTVFAVKAFGEGKTKMTHSKVYLRHGTVQYTRNTEIWGTNSLYTLELKCSVKASILLNVL